VECVGERPYCEGGRSGMRALGALMWEG